MAGVLERFHFLGKELKENLLKIKERIFGERKELKEKEVPITSILPFRGSIFWMAALFPILGPLCLPGLWPLFSCVSQSLVFTWPDAGGTFLVSAGPSRSQFGWGSSRPSCSQVGWGSSAAGRAGCRAVSGGLDTGPGRHSPLASVRRAARVRVGS